MKPEGLRDYITTIDAMLKRFYGVDWHKYASRDQIDRHEREGWDAEKFVAYIAMKFNLDPLEA